MSTMLKENPEKKIEYINSLAASGMTRKEIAEVLGYKDEKNLYAFTYRHGMEWSYRKNLFVVKGSNEPEEVFEDTPTGKVANIISMFDKKADGKDIAKKLRFSSYQEMADYLKSKGYVWDSKRQNYVRKVVEDEVEPVETAKTAEAKVNIDRGILEEYGDVLQLLKVNKDRLIGILKAANEEESLTIPRYNLPGINASKSINITNTVDRLIKDFSEENGISQKSIIEVAVVEFLKKYGFANQVKAVLHI